MHTQLVTSCDGGQRHTVSVSVGKGLVLGVLAVGKLLSSQGAAEKETLVRLCLVAASHRRRTGIQVTLLSICQGQWVLIFQKHAPSKDL